MKPEYVLIAALSFAAGVLAMGLAYDYRDGHQPVPEARTPDVRVVPTGCRPTLPCAHMVWT